MLCHTPALALLQLAGAALPPGVVDLRRPVMSSVLDAPPAPERRPASVGSLWSDEVPVACHYAEADQEPLCERVLVAAQEAWAAQVDRIGFNAPVEDDDGILDFYISTEGTDGGAYTVGPYEDAVTGDGQMSCHVIVVIDPGVPDDELELYVVHEFNHVLQYATDFTEPTYMVWESVASAAESWTYTERPLYRWYVIDFQVAPWAGVLADGTMLYHRYDMWSYYEYGGAVWSMHMEDRNGDGSGTTGAELWAATAQEGWANEPDVLDAWDFVSGDWEAELLDLSAMRLSLGTERAPDWAPWVGEQWVAERAGSMDLSADDRATLTPEIGPFETGVVYFDIESPGAAAGAWLSYAVDSEADTRWAVIAVQDGETVHSEKGRTGAIALTDGGTLTVGVVNLGAARFDGDDTIKSAALDVTFTVTDEEPGDGGGEDSGGTDSGGTDSGDGDSGTDGGTDGGTTDGATDDGGTDSGGQPRSRPPLDDDDEKAGCGCSGLPSPAGLSLGFVLLLPLFRRRR